MAFSRAVQATRPTRNWVSNVRNNQKFYRRFEGASIFLLFTNWPVQLLRQVGYMFIAQLLQESIDNSQSPLAPYSNSCIFRLTTIGVLLVAMIPLLMKSIVRMTLIEYLHQ